MIKSYIPYILFLYLELVGSVCFSIKHIRLILCIKLHKFIFPFYPLDKRKKRNKQRKERNKNKKKFKKIFKNLFFLW